jgi:hypothetical protein
MMGIEEYIVYDETSPTCLRWVKPYRWPNGSNQPGMVAGAINGPGYYHVEIGRKKIRAHQIVWFLHKGEWASKDIDHINRIKTDNRIENLREATRSQNILNQVKPNGKTVSGLRGVTYRPRNGRWEARISIDGKCIQIGTYKTAEEAEAAYKKVKYELEFFEVN